MKRKEYIEKLGDAIVKESHRLIDENEDSEELIITSAVAFATLAAVRECDADSIDDDAKAIINVGRNSILLAGLVRMGLDIKNLMKG